MEVNVDVPLKYSKTYMRIINVKNKQGMKFEIIIKRKFSLSDNITQKHVDQLTYDIAEEIRKF